MKTKLRRFTAMFLVVSMVMSMVCMVPAFATDSTGQIDGTTNPYYYVVGEDTEGTTTAAADVSVDNEGAVNSLEGEEVTVSKTIEGTGNENEFIITLEVNTIEEIEALNLSSDAAVVLVIDNSSSMYQNTDDSLAYHNYGDVNYGNSNTHTSSTVLVSSKDITINGKEYVELPAAASTGYFDYVDGITYQGKQYIPYIQNARIPLTGNEMKDWRITLAKNAATTFADDFMNDTSTTGDRYVSVVSFSNVATLETETGWTDDYQTVVDAIEDMRPINNTYMAPGLEKAYELLQDKDVKNIQNKYVILLADGAANDTAAAKTSATKVNNADNTALYTVSFAKANAMSGFAGTQFDSSNFAELIASLADIQKDIVKAAEAWTVTDPMGDYIALDETSFELIDCDDKDEDVHSVTVTNDGFSWNLRAVTPDASSSNGKTTTYTYKMQYNIKLSTDDDGFKAGTYYLTNGYTHLTYAITSNESGVDTITNGTIDFNVPAVKGVYPEYKYNVEHWVQVTGEDITADAVQKGDKYYVLEDATNDIPEQKYALIDANAKNWENLNGLSYHLNNAMSHTEGTPVALETNGQTLYFYYDRDTTSYTIIHEYYDVSNTDGGLAYAINDEMTETDRVSLAYIGDVIEAKTAETGNYKYISASPDDEMELVAQVTNETGADTQNIITLRYENSVTSEDRTPYTIDVTHVYTDWTWELVGGTYTLVEEASASVATVNEAQVTQYYGTEFEAQEVLRNSNTDYTYEGVESVSGSFNGVEISSLEADSAITLTYYNKPEAPSAATTEGAVIHKYYVEKTYIDDAGDEQTARVLEGTETASYEDKYVGETVSVEEVKNYSPVDSDKTYSYSVDNKDHADEIQLDVATYEEGVLTNNTVTIKYVRTLDMRDEAEVTVYHTYELYEEWIDEDGNFQSETTISNPVKETPNEEYYVGQYFTAIPDSTYHGDSYGMTTEVNDLTIQLDEDEDENIVYIDYYLEKLVDDAADVVVNHYYRTDTTTWIGGVKMTLPGQYAKVYDDEADGHVGEKYTAETYTDDGTYDDYTCITDDPALTVTFGTATQTINVFYVRTVESFTDAGVTVNHIYTTYTDTIVDGQRKTVTETETVDGTLTKTNDAGAALYAGMSYTAVEDATLEGRVGFAAVDSNDTSIILAAGDENVINLYYTKSETNLTPVTVKVIHHYTTNTVTLGEDGNPVTSTSTTDVPESTVYGKYAGEFYTAIANADGFDMTTDAASFTDVALVAGENIIHINYVTTNALTVPATLEVTHIYTTNNYTGSTVVKTFHDETISSWSGNNLVYYPEDYSGLYSIDDVTSANTSLTEDPYTITLEAGVNQITIEYSRSYDDRTPIEVTVNHIYTTYDKYTDVTTNDGSDTGSYVVYMEETEEYTATLVEEFGAYTYDYESGEATIQLDFEDDSNNVINLYYVREVDSTPEVDPTPDPDPDEPVIEIPEEDVPLISIPDEEVPLVSIPDEEVPLVEIPMEEIPLSDIPQTGDSRNMALLMTTALFSALGLAWLTKVELDEKKKHSN